MKLKPSTKTSRAYAISPGESYDKVRNHQTTTLWRLKCMMQEK